LGDPTDADKAVQGRSLEALLRGTRILYSLLADPNFRVRSLLKEFRGRLWQLEHSWGMFDDNPMTEQEADKLLEQYFPDESGA
jgi:hypothetical protein